MMLGPMIALVLVSLIAAMGADGPSSGPGPAGEQAGRSAPPKGGRRMGIIVVAAVSVLVIAALAGLLFYWALSDDSDEQDTIVLYGFSVKGEVFDGDIIPAFQKMYKAETGRTIEFQTKYGGSGGITKEVIQGAPAEVMILSTEWDAIQLRNAGLVTTDWTTFPNDGTVSTSPWVILVRDGNPKGIYDFTDLARPGITFVHPDPTTSGGACWSIFSVYGSELVKGEQGGGTANATVAEALLDDVIDNVISWPSSARQALTEFAETGMGDALITYENEALLCVENGYAVDIVYPESTISSEHKVVLVDANVGDRERETILDFIEFLYTDEVQRYMADAHFRSTDPAINAEHPEFPAIDLPFLVSYLGGWEVAHAELIDGLYVEFKDN